MKLIAFCIFSLLLTITGSAQKQDSIPKRFNIVKINLMSSFLYRNSGAVSFERLSKPNQSWAVTVGYVRFPTLGSLGSSAQVTNENVKNAGYMFGGEYRFYLGKENKYAAPHGVYLGPYTNFYSFSNAHDLNLTSSSGTVTQARLASDITALNIGIQLGYQFVINNRWTIDMVFLGPSVSRYSAKFDLSGNYDITEEDILGNAVLKALTDKFPLVKDLLTNQSANMHGSTSTWSTGFRYQLNIGYHFGRK